MREVVICEPVRTAIGGYGGTFQPLSATDVNLRRDLYTKDLASGAVGSVLG